MKTLGIVSILFLLFQTAWADSSAALPPNPYETQGGTKSPVFSAASSESSHWLGLMDQSQYGPAWSDSGPLMHDMMTQAQWVQAMNGVRKPLGQVRTRRVGSHRTLQSLPGGSKGLFVVIEYHTSFSSKPTATETVTLMMIAHDQWRVISYDVR
jgi:hypothetical protein